MGTRNATTSAKAACTGVVAATLLGLAWTGAARAWDDVDGPAPGEPEPIGRYAAGCLVGGERLPPDGRGYQTIRPEHDRHYGHPELVDFVRVLGARAETAGLGLLPIGDMSQPRGGPMIEAHASHQVGLDVDVYFRLDVPRLRPSERNDIELPAMTEDFGEAQIELLRLAASAPGVARIFVNPRIKRIMCERPWPHRGFLRRLRPWYGHEDHMHVRLDCPSASPDCVPQPAPPSGDGCGTELDGWLARGPLPSRAPGERRPPILPMRCDALR